MTCDSLYKRPRTLCAMFAECAKAPGPVLAAPCHDIGASVSSSAQGFIVQAGNLGQRRLYIIVSIARKPSRTSSVIAFLSVKVFPLRRLLLELACLPSAASPRASSFTSLQWKQAEAIIG